jgi:hypothetical protein
MRCGADLKTQSAEVGVQEPIEVNGYTGVKVWKCVLLAIGTEVVLFVVGFMPFLASAGMRHSAAAAYSTTDYVTIALALISHFPGNLLMVSITFVTGTPFFVFLTPIVQIIFLAWLYYRLIPKYRELNS